jgi:hypothetical protein
MSTEINIKKRIDIQEEGVSITPDELILISKLLPPCDEQH